MAEIKQRISLDDSYAEDVRAKLKKMAMPAKRPFQNRTGTPGAATSCSSGPLSCPRAG